MNTRSISMRTLLAIAACTLSLVSIPAYSPAQESTSKAGTPQDAPVHGKTWGGAGEPTIVSKVTSKTPLAVGQTNEMFLFLQTKEGKPVPVGDLEVVHTEPIHLLIVDPSLADYHHIHPKTTDEVGKYVFPFAPRKGGKYIVFADLHPKSTGIQEYSNTTLDVPGEPGKVVKNSDRDVTVNGYRFQLEFEDPKIVQGKGTMATVKVTGPDGKPFNQLEPLMGAFAHMVGFSEDRENVAHIHPLGKEPEKSTERGGPEMRFYVNLSYPGYHLLYVQVQINGKDVFAPFGVDVAKREFPADAAGILKEADLELGRLENIVTFGPLHRVHDQAFKVRDLALALPERIKGLDDSKKAELETTLKKVKSLAGLLDKYGDQKNAEQTQALFPKFKAELENLHKLAGIPMSASGEVKILGNAKCPVGGAAVGSMEPGAAITWNGIKIGLCCSGCSEEFLKKPQEYLEKAKASVPAGK